MTTCPHPSAGHRTVRGVAIAAALLISAGFLAACVRNTAIDAGEITQVKYSSGTCRIKLNGDQAGWVTLVGLDPSTAENTHQALPKDICAKAAKGDKYSLNKGLPTVVADAEGSITVTARYTLTTEKPARGNTGCVIVRHYRSGWPEHYTYADPADCQNIIRTNPGLSDDPLSDDYTRS
jgi:hypothetical protein